MTDIEDGTAAIRHVVQEHGEKWTELGSPIAHGGLTFFGEEFGWQWPSGYSELLQKHDGFCVRDIRVFAFLEAFETFLLLRSELEPLMLWPIAPDGSGNYYGVDVSEGIDAIVFLEASREFRPQPSPQRVSVGQWLKQRAKQECAVAGCAGG